MEKFKKIGLLVGVFALVLVVAGCSKKEKNVEGKLEDIMTKLYAEIPEDERPMYLENMEINDENVTSFIGTDKVKYTEAIASESMTGSTAHSVVLVRVDDKEDVEKAKKEIQDKIDPRKWICVGVEKDQVIVKSKGNLILAVVVEDETNRDKISKAFDNL